MATLIKFRPGKRFATFVMTLDGVPTDGRKLDWCSRLLNEWSAWGLDVSAIITEGLPAAVNYVDYPYGFTSSPVTGGAVGFSRKFADGGIGYGVPARFTVELNKLIWDGYSYTSPTLVSTTVLTMTATELVTSATVTVPADYTEDANHYKYQAVLKKIEVPWILP